MYLNEMLITETPDEITDEQLKEVSYGLTYGEFAVELQERQRMLQARLRKIEAAEKITRTPQARLSASWEAYRDDSGDDEYEWS